MQKTPYSKALIDSGEIRIQGEKILYPLLGNDVVGYSNNASVLFGKKLTVASVGEPGVSWSLSAIGGESVTDSSGVGNSKRGARGACGLPGSWNICGVGG